MTLQFAPPTSATATWWSALFWRLRISTPCALAPKRHRRIKGSYAINETSKQSGINLMSAQAGGGKGSVGASKSFKE